ncbi:MAG TPA: ATP-binding protein [Thauera aminoaromatica]|nr:ATP-binding protein [Thauera aminoaromatica]HNB05244.1 ATP-binding protein [Thauera aminoaromatica]HNF00101.1 ATP-binding protein [Thauera aminoaromatica]HNF77212.1 ATP-binding protein [Thauera aminoaromatica]
MLNGTGAGAPDKEGGNLRAEEQGRATAAAVDDLSFLALASALSSSLVRARGTQVDEQVRNALQRIAEFFDADRGILCAVAHADRRVLVRDCVHRVGANLPASGPDAAEIFPWLFDEVVVCGRVVSIPSIDRLPPAAVRDRAGLSGWQLRSALFVPVSHADAVEFVLGLGCSRDDPGWTDETIARLRLLGETLAGALRHQALEQKQADSLRFERLIADACARFAGAWSDQIDTEIERALKDVLDFTGADQAGFFATVETPGHLRLTHLNHAEGIVPAEKQVVPYDRICPWLYDRVVNQRRLYCFHRWDEIPIEAEVDRRYLEMKGTRSGLYIPYVVGGEVRHVFALISNTAEMRWAPVLVERIQALGGAFVSALARKSVFDALRRNEEGLREAQRIAGLGSWEWDVQTDAVWTSPQTDLILGSKAGSFKAFMNRVPEDERPALTQAVEACLSGGPDRQRIQHRILAPGGEERFVENHFERVPGGPASAPRIFGTLQDITLRRRDELELEGLRAERWHADRVAQIAVMTSSLAHELSQPLTAILSNAQAGLRMLRAGALPAEEGEAILEDIVADDKRAAQVIESLRAMLRRRPTERQRVEIAQLVRDVMGLMHSELVMNDVRFELDLLAEGCIEVDRAQIQQVLINLIMNGIEAMHELPPGGRLLSLTVTRDERGGVKFSVADVGHGLDVEDPGELFQPYWTTKATGIGMGLAICRSIVEAQGGKIRGENRRGNSMRSSY